MATPTPTNEQATQLLFPPNVQYNANHLSTIKFLAACYAGAAAGVLGVQNFFGFGIFVGATLVMGGCLWLKCGRKPGKYVQGGVVEMLNPGQENLFSFLLAWTLFYGIVHVYD
ncbi:hypothetical protein EUX98_g4313 [Antrodiella citrinella]|uniref:ER membrane protein complex subunit 6 n=1 Tax=Antrodiella citrinella TaxID=2447956 RepID=A0A4S4MUA5_9APHY|nr:hypothetical protein EUX98_g4313 [Antrodiella citrinella]